MDILSTIERAFALFFALISAFGGWEAIKYFANRKSNKRVAEAEADGSEFDVLAKTNQFLQEQLLTKEKQDAAKTERLRNLQDEHFALMKEKSALELELQTFRCCVKKCPNRSPQNWYGFDDVENDIKTT